MRLTSSLVVALVLCLPLTSFAQSSKVAPRQKSSVQSNNISDCDNVSSKMFNETVKTLEPIWIECNIDENAQQSEKCKTAEKTRDLLNIVVLDRESMNYVFGSKPRNGKVKPEVLEYAKQAIRSSKQCFDATGDVDAQNNFLNQASVDYLLSAAIACTDHLKYFSVRSGVYAATKPLNLDDQSNLSDSSWENHNIPYQVPDFVKKYSENLSLTETERFGYTKTKGKITPTNFAAFKNLVTSASVCIYKILNDRNNSNDIYEQLLTGDNFEKYLPKHIEKTLSEIQ